MSLRAGDSQAHGGREVAITFDDLPAISVTFGDVATHRAFTDQLLDGLAAGDLVKATLAETFAGRPKIVQLNHVCLDKGFAIGQTYAAVPAGR